MYEDDFKGERRKVIVNTISYTGWKLVGVIPYSAFIHGMIDVRYFIILLMLLTVMVLVALNRVVSARISSPILKLNASVLEYEAGESRRYILEERKKSGISDILSKNLMSR